MNRVKNHFGKWEAVQQEETALANSSANSYRENDDFIPCRAPHNPPHTAIGWQNNTVRTSWFGDFLVGMFVLTAPFFYIAGIAAIVYLLFS